RLFVRKEMDPAFRLPVVTVTGLEVFLPAPEPEEVEEPEAAETPIPEATPEPEGTPADVSP
ncbi:MAG: hypothetical protein AB1758_32815, partial [Candidatus Eremiobacterota bacterium]